MSSEPKYVNIVLSGGSVKMISSIGALSELVKSGLIDLSKIKGLAGSSAGSVFGLLVVLGFTIDEIWEFINCLDMKKLVQMDLFLLPKKYGMESGQTFYNLLENILFEKTKIKHINFKQLYDITGINFTAVGSCLTTKEAVYYNHINTPTFKVSVAIRISISIPILFTPIEIENKSYIDGCVLNNYAMNLFENELDKTVGIIIDEEYCTKYNNLEEYFVAIINLLMYQNTIECAKKYHNNTIYVKYIPENVHSWNFDLDTKTRKEMFDSGVKAVREFIERISKIDS
jgi:NTE family protein